MSTESASPSLPLAGKLAIVSSWMASALWAMLCSRFCPSPISLNTFAHLSILAPFTFPPLHSHCLITKIFPFSNSFSMWNNIYWPMNQVVYEPTAMQIPLMSLHSIYDPIYAIFQHSACLCFVRIQHHTTPFCGSESLRPLHAFIPTLQPSLGSLCLFVTFCDHHSCG